MKADQTVPGNKSSLWEFRASCCVCPLPNSPARAFQLHLVLTCGHVGWNLPSLIYPTLTLADDVITKGTNQGQLQWWCLQSGAMPPLGPGALLTQVGISTCSGIHLGWDWKQKQNQPLEVACEANFQVWSDLSHHDCSLNGSQHNSEREGKWGMLATVEIHWRVWKTRITGMKNWERPERMLCSPFNSIASSLSDFPFPADGQQRMRCLTCLVRDSLRACKTGDRSTSLTLCWTVLSCLLTEETRHAHRYLGLVF